MNSINNTYKFFAQTSSDINNIMKKIKNSEDRKIVMLAKTIFYGVLFGLTEACRFTVGAFANKEFKSSLTAELEKTAGKVKNAVGQTGMDIGEFEDTADLKNPHKFFDFKQNLHVLSIDERKSIKDMAKIKMLRLDLFGELFEILIGIYNDEFDELKIKREELEEFFVEVFGFPALFLIEIHNNKYNSNLNELATEPALLLALEKKLKNKKITKESLDFMNKFEGYDFRNYQFTFQDDTLYLSQNHTFYSKKTCPEKLTVKEYVEMVTKKIKEEEKEEFLNILNESETNYLKE